MRLSPSTQQLLASIEHRKDLDWMDVIDHLQRQLIVEAIGSDPTEQEIQQGLKILRSAHHLFGENDEEFRQLSLYVRHNRAQRGQWKVGDQAEDVMLISLDGQQRSLFSYHQHDDRPMLVICGSYT